MVIDRIRSAVTDWIGKQGHDVCWYYPEIFGVIAQELGIKWTKPELPSRSDFEAGCLREQNMLYGKGKTMIEELSFTKLNPPERKRTYHFSDCKISIENVATVCVRPSGTHRLETQDGRKFIVNPGWMAVELDVDHWSF